MAAPVYVTREFAFLYRYAGLPGSWDTVELRLRSLKCAVAEAADDYPYGVIVEARRLTPAEVSRWRREVPMAEAEFLGRVFGGIALTVHCEEFPPVSGAAELMRALAGTAWSCGGPVIRLADGELRHGIDWVTLPAEVLCERDTFGEGILLRLHDDDYINHVHECVQATFARAGAKFECNFYSGRGEGSLRLMLSREPVGEPPEPWIWPWRRRERPRPLDCEARLRGQEFRVIAYPPALADDREFWFG